MAKRPKKKIGKIDSILKIRIDNLQEQIDLIDEKYPPESRFYYDGMEVRKELVELRAKLIRKI